MSIHFPLTSRAHAADAIVVAAISLYFFHISALRCVEMPCCLVADWKEFHLSCGEP